MPPKKKADAGDVFADVLKSVSKDYGMRIGSLSEVGVDVESLSTGNLAIDYITDVGGLPLGRLVELYGNPGSGKTTTALMTASVLQKKIIATDSDEKILYMDYENAIDPEYAYGLGLDMDHPSFLFTQPDNLEAGMNVAAKLIATGKVRMAIWDSVAAMLPSAMIDQETGKVNVALRARLMSEALQKLVPLLAKHGTLAVFLNHSMDVIDMSGRGVPGQQTTPGGKALKFYSSVRIEFKQIKQNRKQGKDPLTGESIMKIDSTDVKVKIVKNKVGRPFREATVRVRFGAGFDNLWSAVQVLVGHKILPNSAGYYYFDKEAAELAHEDMDRSATGRPNIRGEEALFNFGQQHPEWVEKVAKFAIGVVDQYGTVESDDEDEVAVSSMPTLFSSASPFATEEDEG